MKRFLLFLLIAFLLTGCRTQQPQETTATQPEPSGLYVPESAAEQQTDGAVRAYMLEDTCEDLYSMGTHLLAVTEGELVSLTGEKGILSAALTIGSDTTVSCVDAAATGVGYYLPNSREVLILNPQLQETARLDMPEDMVGDPVISMTQNQVFYTTQTEIRAIDLQTGISRLIRQQSAASRMQLESHFDGTLLASRFENEAGENYTEYISAQTGQSISKAQNIHELITFGDRFFAHYVDGTDEQMIFGSIDGDVRVFRFPQDPEAETISQTVMLAMNGVFSCWETELGLTLSFVDLDTGKQIAQSVLSNLQIPELCCSDGTYIWFLAAEKDSGRQALYRWDITASAVQGETVYTRPLYTATDPDVQGLDACRKQADVLENRYRVQLSIWKDAEKAAGDYTVTAEHNPNILTELLTQVDTALQRLPEWFLKETFGDDMLHISLVRSIEEENAVQFWDGETMVVLLSSETDIHRWLYQSIAHGVDSHVLGNSRDFDTWERLNPDGFEYTFNAAAPEQSQYTEGADRAFTDLYAMTYPHEDRCGVFAYSMLPGNEEVFASSIMQEKLLRLCMGIREAYGLEESPENYPWEQYLEKAIVVEKE